MAPEWHWTNKPEAERQEIIKKMAPGWGFHGQKKRVNIVCPECETTFEIKQCEQYRRKYCSKPCFNKSKKGVIPPNIEAARANSPIQPGEKNINWNGGTSPYPPEWRLVRKVVRDRDGHCCQRCGWGGEERRDLVVHHIDLNKDNCTLDNLVLLCRICHMKVHWDLRRSAC